MFANVSLRLFGSDDFPPAAKEQPAADLTSAAHAGALTIPIGELYPRAQIAAAHDHVDKGPRNGRVLLASPG